MFYQYKMTLFELQGHNQIKLSTAFLSWRQISAEEVKSLWNIGLTKKKQMKWSQTSLWTVTTPTLYVKPN